MTARRGPLGPAGWIAALVLLLALCVASLSVGAARLPPSDIWRGLVDGGGTAGLILRDIRLPRLILSLSIGASLGLCGAALQGLLRNPLADPAIFGAPQTAALGAAATLYFGYADAFSFALPAAAILGALVSVGAIVAVAGRSGGLIALILAGLAMSSLAGALTSLVINLSPNPFAAAEIVFWMMGSFEDRSMRHVAMSLPFLVVSSAALVALAPAYRALTLGEDAAASLGVDLGRLRLLTVAAVAIGVGGGVAVAGAIGFVGLVAPHVARFLCGFDPARIMAPSALIGAALVTTADALVRIIPATTEIKVGVLTAMIGVPLFLYFIATWRGARFAVDGP